MKVKIICVILCGQFMSKPGHPCK